MRTAPIKTTISAARLLVTTFILVPHSTEMTIAMPLFTA